MYKETNTRSIAKGISWRVIATTTTIAIVYFFFDRLDLAIAAGMIETLLKVGLYWLHERAWFKVRWGRERIEPFNLWFTGLPLSGKTTIANRVYEELLKLDIPLERLDSKEIRDVVPNIGFSREDRNRHMKRIGHLIKTLQNNAISTVASFVSPYTESRKTIRHMVKNTVVVYIKATPQSCQARDYKGVYAKALRGELPYFSGVNDPYEEPQHAEIIIDTDRLSVEEATEQIVTYIKRHYVN